MATAAWLSLLYAIYWLLPILGLPYLILRHLRNQKKVVALTGTFHSENWVVSHIKPIAQSREVAVVYVVSHFDVPSLENVLLVKPPRWLNRLIGQTASRFLTFMFLCLLKRPHIIGGFHFLFNGLYALMLSRLTWASSLYFCVGGDAEFLGGGLLSENKYFEKLRVANRTIEKRLLSFAGKVNLIITMGSRAAEFLKKRTRARHIYVIPGFVNISEHVGCNRREKRYDMIFVGRFSPIKRLDIFLDTVADVKKSLPQVTAVLVGQGQLFEWVKKRIAELKLEQNVFLVGYQNIPSYWLLQAKVSVLCSDSEGLSLALMESGYLGLPSVVSNVGDLGDLVIDGVNGYLISERTATQFSNKIIKLLTDQEIYSKFSEQAILRAQRFTLRETIKLWDEVLVKLA